MNSKINSAACIENSNVCFFGCRLALEWLLLAEIIHGMREFPGGSASVPSSLGAWSHAQPVPAVRRHSSIVLRMMAGLRVSELEPIVYRARPYATHEA